MNKRFALMDGRVIQQQLHLFQARLTGRVRSGAVDSWLPPKVTMGETNSGTFGRPQVSPFQPLGGCGAE